MRLVLASASPQRRALLEDEGLDFAVEVSGIEEIAHGPDAGALALANACFKAQEVAERLPGTVVLGVDTVVELDAFVYGQPEDAQHAHATLSALSGRTHRVHSGMCVIGPWGRRTGIEITEVEFLELNEAVIAQYVALGEWQGRAGGYAIQQRGGDLVREIRGSRTNVIGLPMELFKKLAPEFNSVQ